MNAQDLTPNGRCPRCGGEFRCGVADPAPCPCAGLTLAPELQAALRRRFDGCLCLACLRELQQGAALERGGAAAT